MEKYYLLPDYESRSVSAENFTGEKGRAAMAEDGTGAFAARELGIGWKVSPSIHIAPESVFTLADIQGEGEIVHIWMTDTAKRNRRLILRIYWDGCEYPSVEVPACDFFACANYQDPSLLNSAMVAVNPKRAFNCYWTMPFSRGFRITMENQSTEDVILYYQIDYRLCKIPENACRFGAQFRRTNPLPYKEPYTILDGLSGRGAYVGTYLYWGVNNNGWWGEGEIKFYLDGDKEYPTICGTGTEDYFCGGWNFDIDHHYTPFSALYTGMWIAPTDDTYRAQRRFSLYRWHVKDPIAFRENIRVTIQALGWRSDKRYLPLQDDISSVAYFYTETPADVRGTLPDANGLEIC